MKTLGKGMDGVTLDFAEQLQHFENQRIVDQLCADIQEQRAQQERALKEIKEDSKMVAVWAGLFAAIVLIEFAAGTLLELLP